MVVPSSILGIYQTIQPFISTLPTLKIPKLSLSPWFWVAITMFLLCLLILEGAYRRIKTIRGDQPLPVNLDIEVNETTIDQIGKAWPNDWTEAATVHLRIEANGAKEAGFSPPAIPRQTSETICSPARQGCSLPGHY